MVSVIILEDYAKFSRKGTVDIHAVTLRIHISVAFLNPYTTCSC